MKTNAALGQVKSLLNQYKNIHNIGDVVSAAKNTFTLAKKFFGTHSRPGNGKLPGVGYIRPSGERLADIPPDVNTNGVFNVNKFISKTNASGLARASRFKVKFKTPANLTGIINMEGVELMCDAAEFPGRTFNTNDSRIYGSTFKTPNASIFNEVNFTILCDQNLTEKFIFDMWMNYINPSSGLKEAAFDFEYRDNYTQEVEIIQYSDTGHQTYICKLMEAYPTIVAPITTDWSNDQYHKVQVTMCYRYWTEATVDIPEKTGRVKSSPPSNIGRGIFPSAANKTASGSFGGSAAKGQGSIEDVKAKMSQPSVGGYDYKSTFSTLKDSGLF